MEGVQDMNKIPESDQMEIVTLTPENIMEYGFCGYKDANKHKEMLRKADWYKKYYSRGLRINVLMSQKDGSQGMIEYIPGEYAHRPVVAENYMFIHCLFVGYKKEFKEQGYGSRLIESCRKEAEKLGKDGVAVVSRKGSFMAKREIFVKNGFSIMGQKKPDFELLGIKFKATQNTPRFIEETSDKYGNGLFILRSPQCPYTEKNVQAMVETAEELGLNPKVVDLSGHEAAQANPSPFGTFALIYNGEVLSHHPISNTRFQNIMKKVSA